ncbi:MAG: RT0821/Lpp0805 family surface protein [Methyloceanibacter sp.]
MSVLLPAPALLKAEQQGTDLPSAVSQQQPPLALNDLRSKLDKSDRAAAFQALQIALTELGDDVTLAWRRPSSQLSGKIRPVSAFKDDRGRICRHLVYSLALGDFKREIEGVACREADGTWSIAG